MDCRARRSRKRGYSCYPPRPSTEHRSFIDSISSVLILTCFIAVIYLMLEYHCNSCNSSCDLKNIKKSIADISKNVACIKQRYQELELQITRFSVEIPKIAGQVEMIQALTHAIEQKDDGWDPRRSLPLPNVDVFLHNPPCELGKNITLNALPRPQNVPKCAA